MGGGVRAMWAVAIAVAAYGCIEAEGPATAEVPVRGSDVSAPIARAEWVALIDSLSEPGGFFDTDNLISNESSFLNVLGPMRRLNVYGGAYIGVGPDQNFSYMAQQRPELAFVVDIRRDNLLQHVLFKALFHEATERAEYLALLLGVRVPETPELMDAGIEEILARIEQAPGGEGSVEAAEAARRVMARVDSFGLELSSEDRATIRRFHDEFIRQGLELQYTTLGQPPRPFYPTFGELLAARDLEGLAGSYLARSDDFAFLKALQEANRVVPVVGDLAGPKAVRAIGDEVEERGLKVRAFYVSNVEFFLAQDETFSQFAETVASLPMDEYSVLIRSVFPQGLVRRHPQAQPGDYSTQVLVRMTDLREAVGAGGYGSYWDVVTRDAIGPGS